MARIIQWIMAGVIFSATATNAVAWGNVKLGDADYPVQNPNPSAAISIHGHIEQGAAVQLVAGWYASNSNFDRNCKYLSNWLEGVESAYSVTVPIDMQFSGGEYTVAVFTDAYLLGRCGWVFSGIYAVPAGTPLGRKGLDDPIISVDKPHWYDTLIVTNGKLDAACAIGRDPNDDSYHPVLNCVDRASGRRVSYLVPRFKSATIEVNFSPKP